MNSETILVDLRYDRKDLKSLFIHARVQDVKRGGRYDMYNPPRLNIWTHNWVHRGCRSESSLMFSLEFDWKRASLISVSLRAC